MRALTITQPGGPEVLAVVETRMPSPSADQVLVRVHAAGLNRADLLQRAGKYPAPADAPADIPGLEFAGEITALGPDVRSLRVGQRVCGLVGGGAQAEFVVIREPLAIPLPDNVGDVQGGGIPEAYITAHDALVTQGSLAHGERVLVHAVGSGVGIAALQIAKSIGCFVFGTSRTADKLRKAKELGLDVAIEPGNAAFDEVIGSRTGGSGVDVIVDFIGGPYLDRNLLALATRGRLVVVSTLGGVSALLSLRTLMTKRLRVVGTMLRSRSYEEKVAAAQAMGRDVMPLFERGEIAVPIDRTFALEDAAAAHRYLEANSNFGKVVFTV